MNLDVIIGLVAEGKIREGIEEGKFDDLPGKGKPLVFDDDPLTPPHLRMANRILKNAGVLPDWIQIRKDILTEQEEVTAMRSRLLREHPRRRERLDALPDEHAAVRQFVEWQAKSRSAYLRKLKDVNLAILKYALKAPSTAETFAPYRVPEEMESFDQAFPAFSRAAPAAGQATDERESALRQSARLRYRKWA